MQRSGETGWWLDEIVHAGHEHLDEAYVAAYETKAAFDPAEDVAALVARGMDETWTVADMGAGTGVFAVAIAPLVAHVVAIDVSPAMVSVLRKRFSSAGLTNTSAVEAGFLSYDASRSDDAGQDRSGLDAVFTRNALHQLPDFWKVVALQRIRSSLRPGGILRLRDLIYDMEPGVIGSAIPEWIAGGIDDPKRGFTPEELATHVRTEFSTFSWVFEAMLDRCGFDVVDRHYRRGVYGTYTCVRR